MRALWGAHFGQPLSDDFLSVDNVHTLGQVVGACGGHAAAGEGEDAGGGVVGDGGGMDAGDERLSDDHVDDLFERLHHVDVDGTVKARVVQLTAEEDGHFAQIGADPRLFGYVGVIAGLDGDGLVRADALADLFLNHHNSLQP